MRKIVNTEKSYISWQQPLISVLKACHTHITKHVRAGIKLPIVGGLQRWWGWGRRPKWCSCLCHFLQWKDFVVIIIWTLLMIDLGNRISVSTLHWNRLWCHLMTGKVVKKGGALYRSVMCNAAGHSDRPQLRHSSHQINNPNVHVAS